MNRQGMTHYIHSMLEAVRFLTSIRIRANSKESNVTRTDMLYWYPVVGGMIGVVLVVIEFCTSFLPSLLQAAILVTVWIAITGALHLDGLSDCADAWMGGHGAHSRKFEIMKDPRCGTMGVVAIVLLILMKTVAVAQPHQWAMLLVVPMIARLMFIPVFLWLPYVGEGGLGGEIQKALSPEKQIVCRRIIIAGALAVLLFVPILLWLSLLIVTVLVFLMWRQMMMKWLHGFTGDCIGMLAELSELALVLVFVTYYQMS